MAGKMSIRRHRAASSAISFFEAHGEEIGSAANERTSIFYMEEEQPIDFRLAVKVVSRSLQWDLDRVIAADKAHIDEEANDIQPYLELQEASEEVNSQLVFIRRMLTGFYGVELADEILATDGSTANSDQPLLLWRQGEQTVERLRTTPFKEPRRNTSSFQFNPVALADELEPAVQRLAAAQKVVDLERRKLEATINEKEAATAAFDDRFRGAIRFGVGLCRFAGKPELARRLKASLLRGPVRRRGSSGDDDPSSAPAEESPPTSDETPPQTDAATTGEPQAS